MKLIFARSALRVCAASCPNCSHASALCQDGANCVAHGCHPSDPLSAGVEVWIVSPFGRKVPYALKIQCKRELLDQRQAGGAQRERAVMSKLDHPFVCKLVNTFQDEACIYMLLQFVQGGELLNLIQGTDLYGGLPESAAKFFAAGILEGLTHMHQRQIVYRDLKPENVLLDRDGYAVIVDFGFCECGMSILR